MQIPETELPLVSLIIPVYNGQQYLPQTLESAVSQTYKNLEILVIEDGSEKTSQEIVARFKNAQYFYQKHQGNAQARNYGIELAQGRFISFLDQDDILPADKIKHQVEFLVSNPTKYIVSGLTQEFVSEGETVPTWVRPRTLKTLHRGASPGTWLIRRSLFTEVGTFKPELKSTSDMEWFYRLKQLHYEISFLEEVVLHKRIHAHNQSAFPSYSQAQQYYSEMLGILKRKQSNATSH